MIESLNRGFLYGESVFTTLRMVNGELMDWDMHFDRLIKGVQFVYGPFLDDQDWVLQLKNRLEAAAQIEEGDKVIRYSIYRHHARGLRGPGVTSVSDLKIHFMASPYDASRTEVEPLKLRSCAANTKPHWWPEYLKAGSYLDVILAQKLFLRPGDDDLIFLSQDDTILESSVANIFIVRHNKLYTAPTGPNVLGGIMRQKVINVAKEFFDDVQEVDTTMEQALKADAVFGSNSVRGLFLIRSIDDHEYRYDQKFLDNFQRLCKRVMK